MKKILLAVAALAALCSCATAPELTKSGINPADFETTRDGKATTLYTLTNANGTEIAFSMYSCWNAAVDDA